MFLLRLLNKPIDHSMDKLEKKSAAHFKTRDTQANTSVTTFLKY
jgi:hypothetical protein